MTQLADLSLEQQRFLIEATRLSGPSGDYIALDDSADPLPHDVAHSVSGRLLPLGMALRAAAMEKSQ